MQHMSILLFCFTLYHPEISAAGYQKVEWVPIAKFQWSQQLEQAGAAAGFPIFVARVEYGPGDLIGRYDPRTGQIHTILDGKPVDHTKGQVLVYPRGTVSWTNMKDQQPPPPNLIIAGLDSMDVEALYVCRAMLENSKYKKKIYPGVFKISEALKGCFVNDDGNVKNIPADFELLSLNFLGIATNAGGD